MRPKSCPTPLQRRFILLFARYSIISSLASSITRSPLSGLRPDNPLDVSPSGLAVGLSSTRSVSKMAFQGNLLVINPENIKLIVDLCDVLSLWLLLVDDALLLSFSMPPP
ncbi:hypothetical protein AB1N83_005621 [Pleurotus pulmonarius]